MLTISEMRARARSFVVEWQGETREAAERQSFWNEWFEVFGIRRRRRVTFERNVRKLSGSTGQIDAFWPGMLLVEHKSAGEDLDGALEQAEGYLLGLADEELPRLIVISDFAVFRVLNLETPGSGFTTAGRTASDPPSDVAATRATTRWTSGFSGRRSTSRRSLPS